MKKLKKALATTLAVLSAASALCVPVSASADVYATETMTLEEFEIARTTNANYQGRYNNNADTSSYIYNYGTSCSLQGVYARNGDYVRAVVDAFRLGTDSTQTSYGFYTNLYSKGYLKLSNGQWSTNGTKNTAVSGYVTVVTKNNKYYYDRLSSQVQQNQRKNL